LPLSLFIIIMASLSWILNVAITGQLPISKSVAAHAVEAVDRIAVSVDPGAVDSIVDLQPGPASSIQFLLITSNQYGVEFSYKASDGITDSAVVQLDAPQIFTGGSASLFGLAPRQLKFSNSSVDRTADIEILVARDATP
jgi:hypothetical protein